MGFLATEMTFEYVAPVYIGDTITCTITIIEKDEAKRLVGGTSTFVNQDGMEVLAAWKNGSSQSSKGLPIKPDSGDVPRNIIQATVEAWCEDEACDNNRITVGQLRFTWE